MVSEAGVALSDARFIWTSTPVAAQSSTSAGDIIIWDGDRYRVHSAAKWDDLLYWVIAVREEGQT